jgi:hypothetical protein
MHPSVRNRLGYTLLQEENEQVSADFGALAPLLAVLLSQHTHVLPSLCRLLAGMSCARPAAVCAITATQCRVKTHT